VVLVAPVVPGLDDEVPRVLAAARDAGAARACWAPLRLPGSTAQVFAERLQAALPDAAGRILHLAAEARPGRRASAYAATISRLFEVSSARLGLATEGPRDAGADGPSPFRRPRETAQLGLFSWAGAGPMEPRPCGSG